MRPIRLTMSAFGSYAGEETIDFSGMDHGIFLVTGDTGAGKTTIFDGIVYALYDRTSGGVRDGNMMRSAYADLRTPTFVEFVFLCRGEEYKVVRNPDYERESLRRDKEGNPKKTQEKSKAELYLPDGSLFRGNKKEVNRKIEELIGLDARQFMQVAMIAQGDFLKLLHAKSEERKEIFSRIFDTGIYAGIQEELRRREKEGYVRLKEKEQSVKEQMGRILRPENWEKEEELDKAAASGDLQAVLHLLEEITAQNQTDTKRTEKEKKEKSRIEADVSKILEQAEEVLLIREKREQQEKWLEENLSREAQYKEAEEKADALLSQKEEQYRNLQARQEKEQREFQENQRNLKERLQEMEGLKTLWEKAIASMKKQKSEAESWNKANADYQKKREAYEQMYDAFFREQAGILAQELKNGQPCPVCGSLSHPQKAKPSPHAPEQSQVQAAKKETALAEEERENAQQSYLNAAQQYQSALGSLNQEGRRLLGDNFDPKLDSWRTAAAQAMNKAKAELKDCENLYEEKKAQLKKSMQTAEKERDLAKEASKEARIALETFIRRAESTKGELRAAKEQEESLVKAWKGNSDFSEVIRENKEKRALLQEELHVLEKTYRECYSAWQSNKKTYEVLLEYQKEYEKLREEYVLVRHLSQTAGGSLSGTAKIDFESYIQRQYFERVIHRANQRLVQMTSGQFLLKCKSLDQLKSRGKVGLDLDIHSLVTDSERDVKTLSGGESFMAALAMALGMADVIQDSAGAIRLDTLFIDEGFGSLDENAREQAIRVLYELAGENRLIGIISHVTELKEQIEPKLAVVKSKKGSHAMWLK